MKNLIEPITFKCPVCDMRLITGNYKVEKILDKAFATIHCPYCGVLCVSKIVR